MIQSGHTSCLNPAFPPDEVGVGDEEDEELFNIHREFWHNLSRKCIFYQLGFSLKDIFQVLYHITIPFLITTNRHFKLIIASDNNKILIIEKRAETIIRIA